MDSTIAATLVGLVGLSAVMMVLVQLGKNLLKSVEDGEGNEVGPRRWLAPGVLLISTLLGILFGFARGDLQGEDVAMWIAGWSIAGFLIGATSVGLYGGLKALVPGVFGPAGWIGRK